jgi:hypothetical protein
MKLSIDTPIQAIQEIGNNLVSSDIAYPWEAASRFKRDLLKKGWTDTDGIPELRLRRMAYAAFEETGIERRTREFDASVRAWNAEIGVTDPEPMGEPEQSDADYHGLHERFTQ